MLSPAEHQVDRREIEPSVAARARPSRRTRRLINQPARSPMLHHQRATYAPLRSARADEDCRAAWPPRQEAAEPDDGGRIARCLAAPPIPSASAGAATAEDPYRSRRTAPSRTSAPFPAHACFAAVDACGQKLFHRRQHASTARRRLARPYPGTGFRVDHHHVGSIPAPRRTAPRRARASSRSARVGRSRRRIPTGPPACGRDRRPRTRPSPPATRRTASASRLRRARPSAAQPAVQGADLRALCTPSSSIVANSLGSITITAEAAVERNRERARARLRTRKWPSSGTVGPAPGEDAGRAGAPPERVALDRGPGQAGWPSRRADGTVVFPPRRT